MVLSLEQLRERADRIRLLILDVDGVLTDGSIVLDENGGELKRFHVRDGFGIRCWQRAGRQIAVISGRYSTATTCRCEELGIQTVVQRAQDKRPALQRVLEQFQVDIEQVACIGDDLPDLPMIQACGIGVAVADADTEVRARANWVLGSRGGRGAVRECIELLMRAQMRWQAVIDHYAQVT